MIVRCSNCCRCVPKDKAIKRFQVRNMVDASSQRDLRDASVYATFMMPKTIQMISRTSVAALILMSLATAHAGIFKFALSNGDPAQPREEILGAGFSFAADEKAEGSFNPKSPYHSRAGFNRKVMEATHAKLGHISSHEAQKLYDPHGKPVSIDLAVAQAAAGDHVASAFVRAYKQHIGAAHHMYGQPASAPPPPQQQYKVHYHKVHFD